MITKKNLTTEQVQELTNELATQLKENGASPEVIAFFNKLDRIEIGTTEELEEAHQQWLHSPVVFNAEVLSAVTRAEATK